MLIIQKVALFMCLVVAQGYGQETIDCEKEPFNDGCLQRRAAKRSVGFVSITHCRKQEDFDGSIVLIDVKTTNSTESLSAVENVTQSDERNNTCLMSKLRPKVTGYRAVSNVQIDYRVCNVDATSGYIVLEYTCVKAESNHDGTKRKIQLPQCSGSITGSKIRIDTTDFPDYGWNNTGNDCNCTISTLAEFLNVTTYLMQLAKRQRVSIVDDNGTNYTRTGLTRTDAMVTNRLPVNGTLWLTWDNAEPVVVNSSKFWMEIAADGANISVECFHPQVYETTESPIVTTTLNDAESVPTDVTKQPNSEKFASQKQSSSAYFTTDVMDVTSDSVQTNSSTVVEEDHCIVVVWIFVGCSLLVVIVVVIIFCVVCRPCKTKKETETKVPIQYSRVEESVSVRSNIQSSSQPGQQVTTQTLATSRGSQKEERSLKDASKRENKRRDDTSGVTEISEQVRWTREDTKENQSAKRKTKRNINESDLVLNK